MIVTFRVSNYRSIHSEQSISFVASPDDAHESTHCIATEWRSVPRLLRSAVLVGPNASGKSNMLSAIDALRNLVLDQTGSAFQTAYKPFNANGKPTSFDIDLLLENCRYRYKLSFDADRVISEELRVNITHKAQRWFARRYDAADRCEKWEAFSPSFHGPRELWRKATGPKALFLTTAAMLNATQLAPLIHWFGRQLSVTHDAASTDVACLANHLKCATFKQNAVALLQGADLPVTDIRINDTPGSRSQLGVELLCRHSGSLPAWLDSMQYSSGAHRLVGLLVPLLDESEQERFVVIDEFDTYLHPLVSQHLLKIINGAGNISRGLQVLLVSQTTALMDLDILRRDEIWLMSMDKSSASEIYSLKACSPRTHEGIARGYLKGKYGALPRVGVRDSRLREHANDRKRSTAA